MVFWFYGWESLTLDHHAANFDGFLIRQVISKDRMFKRLCDFEILIVSHHLNMSNGQRPCSIRDVAYLVCHVTSYDQIFKMVALLYAWKPLIVTQHLLKTNGH